MLSTSVSTNLLRRRGERAAALLTAVEKTVQIAPLGAEMSQIYSAAFHCGVGLRSAMMFHRMLLSLFTCTLLGACDPIYGLIRDANLESQPDLGCIQRAIQKVPDIGSLEYRAEHTGKGLFHPTPRVYSYLFRGPKGSDVRGSLQIYVEYDGRVSYRDTLLEHGQTAATKLG